jgi:hypothetical protein
MKCFLPQKKPILFFNTCTNPYVNPVRKGFRKIIRYYLKYIWKYEWATYIFAPDLTLLIKKGRGLWPDEALATPTTYSVVRRCHFHLPLLAGGR